MTATPELPKLPVMHEPLNLIHPPSLLRMVVDYANAHGLACYEAGRGDAHASALRDAERLNSALGRLMTSYGMLLAGKPVRDVAETLGEANRALRLSAALDDNTKDTQ